MSKTSLLHHEVFKISSLASRRKIIYKILYYSVYLPWKLYKYIVALKCSDIIMTQAEYKASMNTKTLSKILDCVTIDLGPKNREVYRNTNLPWSSFILCIFPTYIGNHPSVNWDQLVAHSFSPPQPSTPLLSELGGVGERESGQLISFERGVLFSI